MDQIKVWKKQSLPKSIAQILDFFHFLENEDFLEVCRIFFFLV